VLAISASGEAYGWGTNVNIDWTRTRAGASLSSPVPIQLATGEKWGYVAAGTRASYAITTYGRLWRRAYSDNTSDLAYAISQQRTQAQSGMPLDANVIPQFEFRPFLNKMWWSAVKEAFGVTAGLDAEGNLWVWDERSLAYNDRRGQASTRPKALFGIAPKHKWIDFCVTGKTLYAVTEEGDLWRGGVERLPSDAVSDEASPGPTLELALFKGKSRFARIFCRENAQHVLALDADYRLWGFGENKSGELGNGDSNPFAKNSPVSEADMKPLNRKRWVDIAVGPGFTFGIAADGSLWAWGRGSVSYGQLGIGRSSYGDAPTLVDDKRVWVAVTAGYSSGAALNKDGEIHTWGANNGGVLGEGGAAQYRNAPSPVMGQILWGGTAAGG
jgi:alpha-tubulin suppressor-like RCC1 family protein